MELVRLNGKQEFTWYDPQMKMVAHSFPKGWALKTDTGYISFDGRLPYMPRGGKKALQGILDAGGFLEPMKTVNPKLA